MAATNKKMKSQSEKINQAIRTARNKRNKVIRKARRRLENPNKSNRLTARQIRRLRQHGSRFVDQLVKMTKSLRESVNSC